MAVLSTQQSYRAGLASGNYLTVSAGSTGAATVHLLSDGVDSVEWIAAGQSRTYGDYEQDITVDVYCSSGDVTITTGSRTLRRRAEFTDDTGTALAGPDGDTVELMSGQVRILRPTGVNDHLRINTATLGYVGTVILGPGNWAIAGTVYMRPYCYIECAGINATYLTPVGTVTMFGFDSTAQGYSANQQSWGIKDCTFYGYNNGSVAIDTKMATYAMQDVVIERCYFDGFGDGLGSSSTPVVDIKDPWGLRFENCIIEQTGPRPAMKITGNGASVNGSMVSRLKCKNNAGDGLALIGCESVLIDSCEFYGNTAGTKNLQLSGGKLNIVRGCAFEYGAADGIRLLNSSQGNTIHACTLIGNVSTSQYGIYADTGSSANSIVGCTVLNYSTANLTDNNAAGSNRWVAVYNGTSFVDV